MTAAPRGARTVGARIVAYILRVRCATVREVSDALCIDVEAARQWLHALAAEGVLSRGQARYADRPPATLYWVAR